MRRSSATASLPLVHNTLARHGASPTNSLWHHIMRQDVRQPIISYKRIANREPIAVGTHLIDSSVVGLHRRRVPVLLALGDADGKADDKGDGGYADGSYLYPFLFNHGSMFESVVVCEYGNEL